MFFAEGEYEKFPLVIKRKINELHLLDRHIYETNRKGRDINRLVIDYVILSLRIFLNFYDKLKQPLKGYMEDAIANIPVTFALDKLKIDKQVKDSIKPLLDITGTCAFRKLKKKEIAKETLKRLERLRIRFTQNEVPLKVSFPDYSTKKYFDGEDKFLLGLDDPSLKKEITDLKKRIMKYKEDYNKIVEFSRHNKNVEKETIKFFVGILKLFFKTKNEYLKKRYINKLLEYLAFLFYYKKINISEELKRTIYEFIEIKHIEDYNEFIQRKFKRFKDINKKYGKCPI